MTTPTGNPPAAPFQLDPNVADVAPVTSAGTEEDDDEDEEVVCLGRPIGWHANQASASYGTLAGSPGSYLPPGPSDATAATEQQTEPSMCLFPEDWRAWLVEDGTPDTDICPGCGSEFVAPLRSRGEYASCHYCGCDVCEDCVAEVGLSKYGVESQGSHVCPQCLEWRKSEWGLSSGSELYGHCGGRELDSEELGTIPHDPVRMGQATNAFRQCQIVSRGVRYSDRSRVEQLIGFLDRIWGVRCGSATTTKTPTGGMLQHGEINSAISS